MRRIARLGLVAVSLAILMLAAPRGVHRARPAGTSPSRTVPRPAPPVASTPVAAPGLAVERTAPLEDRIALGARMATHDPAMRGLSLKSVSATLAPAQWEALRALPCVSCDDLVKKEMP